jgi:hypothetical protein
MSTPAGLTPQQQAMLEVLSRGPHTTRTLAEALYSSADGGPLWAETGMRVQIHRLRQKGIPIRHLGPRRGYQVAVE